MRGPSVLASTLCRAEPWRSEPGKNCVKICAWHSPEIRVTIGWRSMRNLLVLEPTTPRDGLSRLRFDDDMSCDKRVRNQLFLLRTPWSRIDVRRAACLIVRVRVRVCVRVSSAKFTIYCFQTKFCPQKYRFTLSVAYDNNIHNKILKTKNTA